MSQAVPAELQDALVEAVQNVSRLYVQNDLRPSELNAGDFIEAAVRILQWLATGTYTPIHRSLPTMPVWIEAMERSSLNDSLRVNVPKVINAMYSIRSRRGVSHIAGEVSANRVDAQLLLTNCRWILAEFVRLYHGLDDHNEAQKTVDLLALSETPIIEDFDGVQRVVTTQTLPIPSQVSLLLRNSSSSELTLEELGKSIKARPDAIRQAVRRMEAKNFAHLFDDGRVRLTGIGRTYAAGLIQSITE